MNTFRSAVYELWLADLREECEYMTELGVFDDFLGYINSEHSMNIDDIPHNMGLFDDIMRKVMQKYHS